MSELATDSSAGTVDYSESIDRISSMLGEDLIGKQQDPVETPGLPDEPVASQAPVQAQAPQTYEVPKSWKKEMHDHWGKVTPEAQAYIIEREKQLLDGFSTFRPVQDALTPYMDWLQRSNIKPDQAVRSLFEAQMRLTQGPMEARRAAFKQLQQNLGLMDDAAQAQAQEQMAPVDPSVRAIQDKLSTLEQHLQAQQEAQIQKIRSENEKLVNDFAADTKAHPYFEEVADEMAIFIRQGFSLQDAYAKAVRTNEAVWAKEQARLLTEAEAKWKENARLASLPKKRAASVNIKSDRDGPEPTEPLGSIEDTIRREHKKILGRA